MSIAWAAADRWATMTEPANTHIAVTGSITNAISRVVTRAGSTAFSEGLR